MPLLDALKHLDEAYVAVRAANLSHRDEAVAERALLVTLRTKEDLLKIADHELTSALEAVRNEAARVRYDAAHERLVLGSEAARIECEAKGERVLDSWEDQPTVESVTTPLQRRQVFPTEEDKAKASVMSNIARSVTESRARPPNQPAGSFPRPKLSG